MRRIEENKICSWFEILCACLKEKPLNDQFIKSIILTSSGKSSLCMILDYLKIKGVLRDKNSEVLVSKWLGYWVYNVMHRHAFPCLEYNKNVKAIIVYHQYGFPQNMDDIMGFAEEKKLVVIEDCAHVYELYYKGKRLGTFGLASIFSFSKMFATFMGGGVLTIDGELYEYIKSRIKTNDSFVSMFSFISKVASVKISNVFNKYVEMSYSVYHLNTAMNTLTRRLLFAECDKNAISKRKKNYEFLINEMKQYEYFKTLEKDVIPYVVPLITSHDKLVKINEHLNRNGFKTGIYNFDVNKNMLNTNFVESVWVPVHHGIDENGMEKICNIIKKAV